MDAEELKNDRESAENLSMTKDQGEPDSDEKKEKSLSSLEQATTPSPSEPPTSEEGSFPIGEFLITFLSKLNIAQASGPNMDLSTGEASASGTSPERSSRLISCDICEFMKKKQLPQS